MTPSGRRRALALLIVAGAVAALVGAAMWDAELIYGDWACAFVSCGRSKP